MADPFAYFWIGLAAASIAADTAIALRYLRLFQGGTTQALVEYVGWKLVPVAAIAAVFVVRHEDESSSLIAAVVWLPLFFAVRLPQRALADSIRSSGIRSAD